MQSLKQFDELFIRNRLPREVRDLLIEYGAEDRPDQSYAPPQVFLAGGFIRSVIAGETVNDIDLFAKDKATAEAVANDLGKRFGRSVRSSDNAYTIFGKPYMIQVIHRWTFDDPEKCVESFDYTIARAAVWAEKHYIAPFPREVNHHTWTSKCDDDFYADLAAHRLVYRSPIREEAAGGSLLRLLKFYRRGYRSPLDTLAAVMARMVMQVRSDAIAATVALDHAQGIENSEERQIAKVLLGLLHEVDPNSVTNDPDYININEEAAA